MRSTSNASVFTSPGTAVALPTGRPVHLESANLITRSLTAADVTPEFVQWFNDAQMLRGLNLNALDLYTLSSDDPMHPNETGAALAAEALSRIFPRDGLQEGPNE